MACTILSLTQRPPLRRRPLRRRALRLVRLSAKRQIKSLASGQSGKRRSTSTRSGRATTPDLHHARARIIHLAQFAHCFALFSRPRDLSQPGSRQLDPDRQRHRPADPARFHRPSPHRVFRMSHRRSSHHGDLFYYPQHLRRLRRQFPDHGEDPAEPWSDPVWLPQVDGIDPRSLFDDDGRAWIVSSGPPVGTPRYCWPSNAILDPASSTP